jgi:hypothetical protein
MMSSILHHWAFYAYVVWVLVVVAVILWPRRACGQGDTTLKLGHKRPVRLTTSKLDAAETCQSEKAVEDLRMKPVGNSSSPCPDGEEAKDLAG